MRLFRWLFWLLCFAAVLYFAATVRLGRKTLIGHIVAIAQTREAHDLAEGTKESAEKAIDSVKRDLARDGGAPAERLTDGDRDALRKLAREKAR